MHHICTDDLPSHALVGFVLGPRPAPSGFLRQALVARITCVPTFVCGYCPVGTAYVRCCALATCAMAVATSPTLVFILLLIHGMAPTPERPVLAAAGTLTAGG
jgi:hypothetical protein